MLIFWMLAALLIVISVVALLRPLLKSAQEAGVDTQTEKLAIYKLQFAELDQDQLSGVLSSQQYTIAKKELKYRLLEEVGSISATHTPFVASKSLAWTILLILPSAAVLTYGQIGNQHIIQQLAQQSNVQQAAPSSAAAEVEPILKSLREKLEHAPNDTTGWTLLARAYGKLHRYDESIFAFEKAIKLTPYDANLLTDYAVVLAMENNRKITEKSQELITRALDINPRQPMALMLAASLAYEHHDYKTAIVLWERLLPDLPINSEMTESVTTSLAKARELQARKR
jgi:cytochrome c-type biogenesis protein CcmH